MDSTQDKIIIIKLKRNKEEVNENKEVIKKEVNKKEVTKEIFLKNKINSKINDYKKVDKKIKSKFPDENINLETLKYIDVMNEINKLTNNLTNAYNCPICKDEIIFFNYSPHCIFQFSIDRINSKKIHSKDNFQIVCYNCNSLKTDKDDFITYDKTKHNKSSYVCECHKPKTNI